MENLITGFKEIEETLLYWGRNLISTFWTINKNSLKSLLADQLIERHFILNKSLFLYEIEKSGIIDLK